MRSLICLIVYSVHAGFSVQLLFVHFFFICLSVLVLIFVVEHRKRQNRASSEELGANTGYNSKLRAQGCGCCKNRGTEEEAEQPRAISSSRYVEFNTQILLL